MGMGAPLIVWFAVRMFVLLGRKAFLPVLPKVSAALSKFITPVASSTSQQQSRRDFERDPKRRRGLATRSGTPSSPAEEAPPPPDGEFHPFVPPSEPPPKAEEPPLTPGQTLLQLFAALRLKRGLSKIFVALAYRATSRSQKASGRVRKGTVLDQKAE